MDKISELSKKCTPFNKSELPQQLDMIVKGLGIPPSFCKFEQFVKISGNSEKLLFQRFTIHVENWTFRPYQEESFISPPKKDWVLKKITTVISMPPLSNTDFFEKLKQTAPNIAEDLTESIDAPWQAFNIIQNPSDGILFKLNSKNKWSAWTLVATNASQDDLSSYTKDKDEDTEIFLSKIHGANINKELLPFTAIITNQRLIRISGNRLGTENNEECIKLQFETGINGLYRAENAHPNLKYQLFDEHKAMIGQGKIPLKKDHFENGLILQPDREHQGKNKKIIDVEAGLYLGETLVDTFSGGYIREVKVNISISRNSAQ